MPGFIILHIYIYVYLCMAECQSSALILKLRCWYYLHIHIRLGNSTYIKISTHAILYNMDAYVNDVYTISPMLETCVELGMWQTLSSTVFPQRIPNILIQSKLALVTCLIYVNTVQCVYFTLYNVYFLHCTYFTYMKSYTLRKKSRIDS